MKSHAGVFLFFFCGSIAVLSACGGDSNSKSLATASTHDRFPKAPLSDAKISAAACLPEKNFYKNHQRDSYSRPSEIELGRIFKLFVPYEYEGTSLAPVFQGNCETNLCKIQSRFGVEEAERMIYIFDRFGFNTSRYQDLPDDLKAKLTLKDFTVDELDTIIRGLHSFPLAFRAPGKSHPLVRVQQTGTGVYASVFWGDSYKSSVLTLSNLWVLGSEEFKIYVLIHEMGHVLDMDVPMLEDWRKLSNWPSATGDKAEESRRIFDLAEVAQLKNLLTDYSFNNPAEDFAESVAYYRLAPEELKAMSEEKYRWIKYQIYQGLEFNSEEECNRPSACWDLANEVTANQNNMPELNAAACDYYFNLKILGMRDDDLEEWGLGRCIRRTIAGEELKLHIATMNLSDTLKANFVRACAENNSTMIGALDAKYKSQIKNYKDVTSALKFADFKKNCEMKIQESSADKNCVISGMFKTLNSEQKILETRSEDFDKACEKYCLIKNPEWTTRLQDQEKRFVLPKPLPQTTTN